ncbi:MAG TPA: T9SS type A sorting domain-containing protein [Flavobacteriales bacterium]|jgi:hypothetical protein|nr:T9SS type A sorting domain-containing protein [Flavobacteriales bacterium]
MKQTSTLLAALALTLSVHAQPTLTFATNAPVIGTSYTLHYGSYVAPGNAGALQSWDLSGLSNDSTDVLQMVAPSTTTNGAQFPTATMAELSSPVTTYYQVSPDGIRFAGSDDGTSLIVNAPMARYLAFPCTMGSSWSTPHAATFTYDDMEVFRVGQVSCEADGYGTLTMPGSVEPNVLRIHMVNLLHDSLELFEMDYIYDSYLYYKVGQSFPIAELVTATIDIGFGTPQTTQFSRWTTELSTGITAPSITTSALHLFPNPTNDVVNVEVPARFGSTATASVVDASGRVMHQEQLTMNAGSTTRVDVRDLQPGIYTLLLTDGQGQRVAARLSKR